MWLSLWSYARIELGLSKREFLALNWAQWQALRKRRDAQREAGDAMLEFMLAQLTAMVANTGFKGWPDPRKPEEFMPSRHRKKAAGAGKPLTKRQRERQFTLSMARTMRQLEGYQKGQVARGIQ